MFTGITEHVGKIDAIEKSSAGGRLRINLAGAPRIASALEIGASIAVNGCCLTVVELDSNYFAADLSGETLCRTSFGEMKPGQIVNLERPLAAGAPVGGHFVQGHVDGVGRVTRLVPEGPPQKAKAWWLSVRVPEELSRYVAMKGSIAIDGISLTVARWENGIADVAIIPHTYTRTNVREMTAGDAVNLECDILAKYAERLFEARREPARSRLSVGKLTEEGF